MVVDNRRAYLLRHIDMAKAKGLEIGPYLNPTVRKDEGDIRYLDFYSTEELQNMEQDRRSANAVIPHVDFVVKSDDYYRYVDEQFDYVIANHVIEHVDNPLQWLIDLARLVKDDGVIFLTVPDKKYNFDHFRTDTPLSHLLTDYMRGHGDPVEHGVDIFLNYDTNYIDQPIDLDHKLNIESLRGSFQEETHPGRHNHVFQSETFVARVLKPLQRIGIWPYTMLDFGPATENHGEFYVVLRKQPEEVEISLTDLYGLAAEGVKQVGGTTPSTTTPAEPIQSSEARETELHRVQAELAATRGELDALRRSLSWRMTGPVRKILAAFN